MFCFPFLGSSEADAHHRTLKEPSSDSVGSLMSMSGHSNCSSSPLSRRHSVTSMLCCFYAFY